MTALKPIFSTGLIRNALVTNPGSGIDDDYLGLGDYRAGRIGDASRQRCIRRLGMKGNRPREAEQGGGEADDSTHGGSPVKPQGSGWSV